MMYVAACLFACLSGETQMLTIVFIGAGKMATALAQGIVQNKLYQPQQMVAVDPNPAVAAAFSAATGISCHAGFDPSFAVAEVLILAVKPQIAAAAVQPLAEFCQGKLIISIAAGIRLEKLCQWFGHQRVVRVMPNTPLTVGKGASVFCCAAGAMPEDGGCVAAIFGAAGIVHELPESAMDAVTALSGSGPAYVFALIEAMIDAGIACGLPAEIALELSGQTVAGAAAMIQQHLGSAAELRQAVTSPGGTTAAALQVFECGGFAALVGAAICAACDRSVELGKSMI